MKRLPQRAASAAYVVALVLVLLDLLVRRDAFAPRFDLFGLDTLLVQQLRSFREHGVPDDRVFAFEDAAVEICQRLGLDCLNLYPLMLARRPEPPLYNSTDLHLTRPGTRFVASAIHRHLTRDDG